MCKGPEAGKNMHSLFKEQEVSVMNKGKGNERTRMSRAMQDFKGHHKGDKDVIQGATESHWKTVAPILLIKQKVRSPLRVTR